MKKLPILLFISFFLSMSMLTAASSHADYIHSYLENFRICRTGAITDNYGYLVFNQNTAVYSGIPKGLADYLDKELSAGNYIEDVCITEGGAWICVGDNIQGYEYPPSLWGKISELLRQGDHITCITFNDFGDWMVVSNNHFSSSNNFIQQTMLETSNEYGFIQSVAMTNYNCIIIAHN